MAAERPLPSVPESSATSCCSEIFTHLSVEETATGLWRFRTRPAEGSMTQQIRGRGSPTNMSTIRVPPNVVRNTTMPGGVEWIRPISVASAP
jgi:hypothetical protein